MVTRLKATYRITQRYLLVCVFVVCCVQDEAALWLAVHVIDCLLGLVV